uniref:Uncharacterized protein n=1 Tax=Hordeum vulgare subsp. vulgare TaxID=112509 RepID=A0A8I7BDG7_HORVV
MSRKETRSILISRQQETSIEISSIDRRPAPGCSSNLFSNNAISGLHGQSCANLIFQTNTARSCVVPFMELTDSKIILSCFLVVGLVTHGIIAIATLHNIYHCAGPDAVPCNK